MTPSPKSPRLPVSVPLPDRPGGFIKAVRAMQKNALAVLPRIAFTQPVVSGQILRRFHMVMHPPSLKKILKDKVDAYPKAEESLAMLRPALGSSLFLATGSDWRWQRRAAAPVFAPRNLTALAPIMTEAAEAASQRIAAHTGPIDLADEMLRTAFDVIAAVSMSQDTAIARDVTHRAIERYLHSAGRTSPLDVLRAPRFVPRPRRVIGRMLIADLKRAADAAIRARMEAPPADPPPLLDLLIAAQDPETGRRMSAEDLRDNLLTFIVAGHETTALTLAWALYLCAYDPDVQEAAAAQAREVLGDRPATADDVANLPLIRAIVDEALRLYPPAGLISRTALEADELCGREIKPGDSVMIPIYALHRNQLLWADPDRFDPGRFADGVPVDRYAYLPFGDGPRICIGAGFAVQEAVIILATLLARFRFSEVAGREPKPVMIITLRPEGGVWLMAEPR